MIATRVGVLLGAAAVLLAGCTSGSGGGSSSSASGSSVAGSSVAGSSAAGASTSGSSGSGSANAPLDEGTVRATAASSCPLLGKIFVQDTVGMRLAKITVLRTDRGVAGCRFYPLSHPTAECDASCLRGEHLPDAGQPAVEITTSRYASATAAGIALKAVAAKGANPQQNAIASGTTAACFQTDFYPKDNGKDWACGFTKGARLVVIRTVVTTPALNAFLVAKKAYAAV